MNYKLHRQFAKDFKKLPKNVQAQVLSFIEAVEKQESLAGLEVKKISGYQDRFRFRIGSYRVGFSVKAEAVIFRRVLDRQSVYKKFP